MIQDCTAVEKGLLAKDICPDCNSKSFYLGPEGGGSINIMCSKCGARFNVAPGSPSFAQRLLPNPPEPYDPFHL